MRSVSATAAITSTKIAIAGNPSTSGGVVGTSAALRSPLSNRRPPNENNENQNADNECEFCESYIQQRWIPVRNVIMKGVLREPKIVHLYKRRKHMFHRAILKRQAVSLSDASVRTSEFLLVLLVDRIFAGVRVARQCVDGVPAFCGFPLHRFSAPPVMTALPQQINHNDKKEQANQQNVHNNTKKQSDTSNE